MASSNTQINLSSLNLVDLDYYSIKTSLKNFLRQQNNFRDYDYEGPNMATLLRLLSYNTYINAFYTNMALSEAHLDSAQLRSSILSHAKDLNYLPRSVRSSRGRVKVDFEATSESQPYTIQKGSTFSSIVKNTNYTFSIPETLTVASANNTFSFETDVYEGFFVKDSFVFTGIDNERFRISNKNVDLRSLAVTVYEDGDTIGEVYVYQRTLLDITSKSQVFFLQSAHDGYYEVLFGDDILGKSPKIGATIVLDYRIAAGPASDGASLFALDFDPTGIAQELNDTPLVTTVETAKNGQDEENDESIRYYAPRSFQVQERTVVDNDYSVALRAAYPEINVIHVYGGEEANPPRWGKVFVVVDLTNVDGLPENKKLEYASFLRKRSPFGIDPIFVEPEYLYVDINALVRFNVNITTNSPERIKTLVQNAIISYRDVNLDDFAVTYRDSEIYRTIDYADASIVSSIADVRMYKKLDVTLETAQNYIVDFGTAIKDTIPVSARIHAFNRDHAITSDSFTYNGETVHLEDTGAPDPGTIGQLRIIQRQNDVDREITRVGTVDYSTGLININNLNIQNFEGASFKIFAYPKDKDITATKNTILSIEASAINIKTEELRLDQ